MSIDLMEQFVPSQIVLCRQDLGRIISMDFLLCNRLWNTVFNTVRTERHAESTVVFVMGWCVASDLTQNINEMSECQGYHKLSFVFSCSTCYMDKINVTSIYCQPDLCKLIQLDQ